MNLNQMRIALVQFTRQSCLPSIIIVWHMLVLCHLRVPCHLRERRARIFAMGFEEHATTPDEFAPSQVPMVFTSD